MKKVDSIPGYQELFDEIIAPQFKTGVWCGFTIRMPFIPPELCSNAIPEFTVNGVRFTFWTMEERLELIDDIEQAESLFNPYHLEISRNPDGSTDLWRECNGANWEYLWRECVRKLAIIDNFCDKDNDTDESPATYVVCWEAIISSKSSWYPGKEATFILVASL
jgi:hypothetical protein